MLRWYIVKLKNENNLLVEIYIKRKACNRKQDWNTCSKKHAHVNQGKHLSISPMAVKCEPSMSVHVLVYSFTFGLVLLSFKHRTFFISHFPNFKHDLNEKFKEKLKEYIKQ